MIFLLLFALLIALTTFPLKVSLPVDLFLLMDPLLIAGASLVTRAIVDGFHVAVLVLATTALTVLGSIVGSSWLAGALGLLAALALNVGLFLGTFRLLSPGELSVGDLLPGALVAGASWQLLQLLGQWLVLRNLRHTQQLYGQFAVVLGLIYFLSIATQLIMYAVEVNVVRHKRLWPRSIIQPPLLPADRKALALRATQEARRPEQLVDVSWRPAADGEGE